MLKLRIRSRHAPDTIGEFASASRFEIENRLGRATAPIARFFFKPRVNVEEALDVARNRKAARPTV